jgi:peptidoglycan/xylan/chitin deacetylase (PgdA/CDA1 family)
MFIKPALACLSPAGPRARLSILIFHRVRARTDPLFPAELDAAQFGRILGWLSDWFNVLPLDEAVARLANRTLPARAASITFDDGYADNFECALPILQAHGLKATFFIATDFIDGSCMWNDRLIESVRGCRKVEADLGCVGLGSVDMGRIEARRALVDALLLRLKHLEPGARSARVLEVEAALGKPALPALMMSSGQIRALRRAGMQIGAHTCSHPILASTADDEARREIERSKAAVEGLLDEPVGLFAYPNGKPSVDYGPRHVEMVRAAGFTAAVSTAAGVSTFEVDRFLLPRFSPWGHSRLRYAARLIANVTRRNLATA